MKRLLSLLVMAVLIVGLTACGSNNQSADSQPTTAPEQENTASTPEESATPDVDTESTETGDSDVEDTDDTDGDDDSDESDDWDDEWGDDVEIKESPDKYTWYVNNYVGQNLASFGYTSLGGDRMDEYGEGRITLIPITADGSYIDIEKDEKLQEYVVKAQDLPPNTELKFTFRYDSKGKEYDNLVDSQNYEEIVLLCEKLSGDDVSDPVKTELTELDPSDRKNYRIRDYVGRNLLNCGYTSLGGDRMDEYDDAHIKFQFITSDGSYINPEKEKQLKKYYVTAQSVKPNKVMKVTYDKRKKKSDYYHVKTQSIETIKLKVKKIGS